MNQVQEDLYRKFTKGELNRAPNVTLCSLTGKKSCCKSGILSDCLHAPAEDHCAGFVNKKTREKVFTIQPYFSRDENGEPFIELRNTPDNTRYTIEEFTALQKEFAEANGMTASVSMDGWHVPGFVVLVVYRKA